MFSRNSYFMPVLLAVIVYILYVMFMNFIFDPQASAFLDHKEGLKRPIQLPIWLVVMYVHVVFACIAMLSGLLNFSSQMLKKYRRFHRLNGYAYVVSVLIVDITSGYMAPFSTGGKPSSIAFNVLNIVWLVMTVMALVAIRKKQLDKHRNWMIRSYVYCFTNLFIHLFTFSIHKGLGIPYVNSYTISIYCAIALLAIIAEIIIRAIHKHTSERCLKKSESNYISKSAV